MVYNSRPTGKHEAENLSSPPNSFPDAEIASRPRYQQRYGKVSEHRAWVVDAR